MAAQHEAKRAALQSENTLRAARAGAGVRPLPAMSPRFHWTSTIAAPPARVWAFHCLPNALQRLTPPWQPTQVLQPPATLAPGTVVKLRAWFGPVPVLIIAEHTAWAEGEFFVDEMRQGPFKQWRHGHRMQPVPGEPAHTRLSDEIEYQVAGPAWLQPLAAAAMWPGFAALFWWRHRATRLWCESAAATQPPLTNT